MNGQEYIQLTLYPVASPASPSALPGSEEARTMTVISDRKCFGLSKSCGPIGLLEKTSLDLFELHLMKYYPNLKQPDMKRGHTVAKLGMSAHCFQEKELPLWPRPTTGASLCGGTGNYKQMKKLAELGVITEEERQSLTSGGGGKSNPALMEWLMGFPIGWTESDA